MPTDGPKLTVLDKIIIFLVVAGCLYGTYIMLAQRGMLPAKLGVSGLPGGLGGGQVEIGIAYGTEKERWLKWAVEEFAKTDDGKHITINLIPKGSVEGARAIAKDEDTHINVWSPASSLYKDIFAEQWQSNHNTSPILKGENLALTPMVFIMWNKRYQAFTQKYHAVTFNSVAKALQQPGGWNAIAGKPDWGLFKFGHTHPNKSNSGLMTLILMAYDYAGKNKGLGMDDITSVNFQTWLQKTERCVADPPESTGDLARDMVLKGPSTYDAVFVYESVAIDYLKNAEDRWGDELHVVYPEKNIWNDNPYYILDVPWSTKQQREAADTFLRFLMSERIQKEALVHGFRPGDPAVSIRFPESPFVKYNRYGLKIDIATACESPKPAVITNLQEFWQRTQGDR